MTSLPCIFLSFVLMFVLGLFLSPWGLLPTNASSFVTFFQRSLFFLWFLSSFLYLFHVPVLSRKLEPSQCDQIGRFLKVLGDDFSYKSSPNVCWLFEFFWMHQFSCIYWFGYFLCKFRIILALFIFQHLVTLNPPSLSLSLSSC